MHAHSTCWHGVQVAVYMPYPHFRPRLRLHSMQRTGAAGAAVAAVEALTQAASTIEEVVLAKLPSSSAHQCLTYLMCQALYAMAGLRTEG